VLGLFGNLANAVNARSQFGTERNGLALLVAYCLEGLQQLHFSASQMVGAGGPGDLGNPCRGEDQHKAERRRFLCRAGLHLADQEQHDHDEADGDVCQIGHAGLLQAA
jgi:hypothetical protein